VAELKAEIAKIEKAEVDRLARLAREAAREVHLAMLEREATTLREKLAAMKGPEPPSGEALEAATPPVEAANAPGEADAQPEAQAAKPSQSEEMLNLLIGVGVYMALGAWLWSILSARTNELF
jgi:hypothetical protein